MPLGIDMQIVMFDSSRVGPFAFGPPVIIRCWRSCWWRAGPPWRGNQGLQSVMKTLNPVAYYPEGVKIALHGHVHDFQTLNFSTAHPATFVTGNGGGDSAWRYKAYTQDGRLLTTSVPTGSKIQCDRTGFLAP
ncbi:MAG: hypothetical protein EON48_16765 [Acetobacteraceae bacterium]|nr:MAG: hypothetical protein EON48_16765 [Acetobacteraceae bacterium]